ncbi:hypothetical protein Bbelb_222770 [Branchiostoma belcheri]|nr:hypothetical protein Bbelb_222770 [Branchiostoma belcheri]
MDHVTKPPSPGGSRGVLLEGLHGGPDPRQLARLTATGCGGPRAEIIFMAQKVANEALLEAADSGCLQGVKAALKAGADIDYAQGGNHVNSSRTALFLASGWGHADIVKLLLRKGASVTKRANVGSLSALHFAATQGHTEVVELLVQHGATLDIRDCFQRTPLMVASRFRQVGTFRRLIELGARPDLADVEGTTVQRQVS